jgi:hypothetical protein
MDVHLVWVGNKLSLIEQLTIKLFQKRELIPNLWVYDKVEGVPEGTCLRDAEEILPRTSLFKFKHEERGSAFAPWSDQFQLTVLQRYGGWYSQLDVACIKLPVDCDYYFALHQTTTVDTCIMKAPKDAPFINNCIKELSEKINERTCNSFDWEDSMRIVGAHVQRNGLSNYISKNVASSGCSSYMHGTVGPATNVEFIHWWNAQCPLHLKNNPEKGSCYYRLLEEVGLV